LALKIDRLPKVESSPIALTRIYVPIPERTDAATGIVRASEFASSGFLLDWLAGAGAVWSVNSRAKGDRVERTI